MSIWRPYYDNFHMSDFNHFPRYRELLFSFQSAIGSEVQNVKHMAAILKSNMAAP